MKRLDARTTATRPDEVLGFARVRNEALRLPWFLTYHRRLGVSRFFIVDNASTDGTTDFLASQPDVHVFWTQERYADNASGMDWINPLLDTHGHERWRLTLDADELFVFPHSEERSLAALGAHVREQGADAVRAHMIDMYAHGPIREARCRPGADFLSVCEYFDRPDLSDGRSGARRRLFWRSPSLRAAQARPPVLRKFPFTYGSPGSRYRVSTHVIDNAKPATVSGAILHFKFFSDFAERTERALRERQYWNGSEQYERYAEGLEADPDLCAHHAGSIRFAGTAHLTTLGVLQTTPAWDSANLIGGLRDASDL